MKILVAFALFAACALSANAATTRAARVTIAELAPFTVHGSRFVAHERVTLVVEVKVRRTRVVVASETGEFTARFLTLKAGHCDAYFVRATGDRGSVARLKIVPECSPLAEP